MGSVVAMRYLLDTHIWLWSLLEPDRIGAPVLAILQDDDMVLITADQRLREAHEIDTV